VSAPATLEQVAALAGVSRSTVSRVVNASPRVSPAARAAVETAIAQLGYVPNPAARTLVTRRTGSVALVVHETEERVFEEPFFAGVVRGAGAAVADHDRQLVLLLVGTGERRDHAERFLFGGHVDGVLLLSLHGADLLPQRLLDRGVATVLGGRPPVDDPRLTWVDADNVGGAHLATAHLLATGRHTVATIAGPDDMVASEDRLRGYRRARAAAGLAADPDLEERGDFSRAGGHAAAHRLLARRPAVDGIVAPSDLAAAGVLDAVRELGRRVPDDVAVTGFDDSTAATSVTPQLTTVHQHLGRLGREMVHLLVELLDGEGGTPAPVVLPTELVVRAST
jgi:DNA-binding LacI/PurR family transcriptional regulator